MSGYPYHFQYQDGTPYWLFGDTQWESFADDPGQGLSARSMSNYFTIRARQGFNKDGTTFTLLSPDPEDWVYEAQKN